MEGRGLKAETGSGPRRTRECCHRISHLLLGEEHALTSFVHVFWAHACECPWRKKIREFCGHLRDTLPSSSQAGDGINVSPVL